MMSQRKLIMLQSADREIDDFMTVPREAGAGGDIVMVSSCDGDNDTAPHPGPWRRPEEF